MDQSKNLPNFQKVNDNLYRGGQPKKGGFAELKRLGIKTVIYLRSDEDKAIIAIYRMTHEGWDAKRAGDEAKEFGIGWWQRGMRDFINEYYRDQSSMPANPDTQAIL